MNFRLFRTVHQEDSIYIARIYRRYEVKRILLI